MLLYALSFFYSTCLNGASDAIFFLAMFAIDVEGWPLLSLDVSTFCVSHFGFSYQHCMFHGVSTRWDRFCHYFFFFYQDVT